MIKSSSRQGSWVPKHGVCTGKLMGAVCAQHSPSTRGPTGEHLHPSTHTAWWADIFSLPHTAPLVDILAFHIHGPTRRGHFLQTDALCLNTKFCFWKKMGGGANWTKKKFNFKNQIISQTSPRGSYLREPCHECPWKWRNVLGLQKEPIKLSAV